MTVRWPVYLYYKPYWGWVLAIVWAVVLSGGERLQGSEVAAGAEQIELVGVIRQGDGGSRSGSVALLRRKTAKTNCAVVTGGRVPFAAGWILKRVSAREALLASDFGRSVRLGVAGEFTEGAVERDERQQAVVEDWYHQQLARLEWADTFSFSEIDGRFPGE